IAVIVVASAREMGLRRQRDAVVAAESVIETREGMTSIVLLATHVMAGIVVSIVRVAIAEVLLVIATIEMTAIAVDTEISPRRNSHRRH
uniref:RRM domain-containing protein n=1 Tax=Parascaris univalens TaxID=6257 RepID=A0A914ZUG1_PARUN